MFDDELIDGITDGLVGLDARVGELERKENPAQSGIGPFEFEVHVDIAGGGDYTSVKAAADYVLANAGASEYWTIVVHAGNYNTETPFELPANTALVGIGNAFIFSASTSGTFITLAGNCTIRNITLTLNMDPTLVDCWAVECSGYVVLENCTFYVSRNGGSGSSQTIGVVKTETGDINNCWLRLYVQESSYPGARNIVRFDDANPLQESYLRDCTLGFAIDGSIVDDTSSTVYAQGHPLWVIDCVIQKRSSAQAGYDLEAGAGSIIYTSGTLYVKTNGTIVNLDTSVGAIGTVTSVALTVPSILSVAGSPVTTAGTLAVTLATQAANLVFAGPSTGAAAAPTFRTLVAGDMPAAVVLGGGNGVAGRIPVWSDANTLVSDADFTFNTALNTLISGGRAGFGGVTSITEIFAGFGATSDAIVEVGSATITASDNHAGNLVLSARQNAFPNKAIGAISWANRQSAAADLRLAAISVYTAADADEGYLAFYTAPAGGGLLEAMRVTENQALWIGSGRSLTGAGDLDVAGNVNVDGAYTGKSINIARTDSNDQLQLDRRSDDTGGGISRYRKARDSAGAAAIVQSGDTLGNFVFQGYDGSAYRNAALFRAVVDGTPGSSDMPGRLEFATTPDGSASAINRVVILSGGAVEMYEITAPAAPAANAVRVFPRDDGAGVTELCARFATGDIIPIARQGITIQTYAATNVTTDRTYDADTVAIAELADVVGTLIADLRAQGIVK